MSNIEKNIDIQIKKSEKLEQRICLSSCEIYNYVIHNQETCHFCYLKTIIFVIYNVQSSYDLIEERRVFDLCIFSDLDLTLCE